MMDRIWWNQVTNAVRFKTDIGNILLEEKNIILNYSDDMPWRDQFRDSVQDVVMEQQSDKKFEEINGISDPGPYLLEEFCKPEKRAEYRPQKGYARFFAESNDIVLHDRYLWIRVNDIESLNNWYTLAMDYNSARKKNENKAVFILEYQSIGKIAQKKGFKLFSLDDYIGDYDRIVFAVLASSSRKETPFLNSYLAELVANMIENDIELAAECINDHIAFLSDPADVIDGIVKNSMRSDGTEFSYAKTREEIEHLIWRAQIKTVYPYLEEYREDFVQMHYDEIAENLQEIKSEGDDLDDPKDVELGPLLFLSGRGYITLSQDEKNKLKQFRDARNKLSHLSYLSLDEIKKLIE